MKVALIVPEDLPVPPERGGSIQIYLHELSKRLQPKVDVTVITRSTRHGHAVPGVRYLRINRSVGYKQYVARVCDILRRESFDVVQVDNRPKYITKIREACPQVPIVLNLHSMTFLYPRLFPPDQAALALQQVTAINTVSQAVRRRLLRCFPVVAAKTTCIYAGVNSSLFLSRFTPAGEGRRTAIRNTSAVGQTPVLLYIGRLVARKGIDSLIDAVRLLIAQQQKVQLWIVGGKSSGRQTAYEQELRAKADDLPVRFYGFVEPTQLADYYLAADILVCPSQLPEGLPLVILEGACSGLPVVASGHSGISECVRNGETGILVRRYKRPAAIARAMEVLLNDSGLAQRYGNQAAHWVTSTFTWEQTATGFTSLYEKAIGDARSAQTPVQNPAVLE